MLKKRKFSTTRILAGGFLLAIAAGTVLLSLPFASAGGVRAPLPDALFTAVSAVCVTGLVTLPTYAQWSPFGQLVILILIELGGLGIITFSVLFLVMAGHRIGIRERMLLQAAYSMDTMEGVISMGRRILKYTVIIEGAGALLVTPRFVQDFGLRGIWVSIFHAVSAFCNAGMDIIGPDSLGPYADDAAVLGVTAFLIVSGGIGFPVLEALAAFFRKGPASSRRICSSLYLKTVLVMTGVLIFGGTAAVLLLEGGNPETLGAQPLPQKLLSAFFQSVTLRTAGFCTFSQAGLRGSTCLLACVLMFIGGSPSGTAGGIKTTAFLIVTATVVSMLKEKDRTQMFRRKVSANTVRRALAIFAVSFTVLLLSLFALLTVQPADFTACLFEAVSAIGTVGLSRDLTPRLNLAGKAVIMLTMYLGRIGPISLSMFFNTSRFPDHIEYVEEPVNVG